MKVLAYFNQGSPVASSPLQAANYLYFRENFPIKEPARTENTENSRNISPSSLKTSQDHQKLPRVHLVRNRFFRTKTFKFVPN